MEHLNTLYDLYETVSKDIHEANEKIKGSDGKLSVGDVDYLDKLTHMLKSIKTTIAMMEAEDGYSGRNYMPTYYGSMNGRSYADGNGMGGGNSYARGRSNAKRDSMGRYSRNGGYSYHSEMDGLLEQMRGMLRDLPEEKRHKAQRLMDELEKG